jgi:hypothetical protein
MRDFDIKTAPIQFVRIAPGDYASIDGCWRIHRTEHTGYMSTLSGRARWWITDRATKRQIRRPFSGSAYALSLTGAIEDLHRVIGGGVVDAFCVLHDMHREALRADEARIQREANRHDIASKIAVWVVDRGAAAIETEAGRLDLAAHLEEH